MKCPQCGDFDDKVIDTRSQKCGDMIRRRRECLSCGFRYSTVESIVKTLPEVVKKSGRKEAFSRTKILNGLQAACQKRPVQLAQLEGLVDNIVEWALDLSQKEISSHSIGEQVIEELRLLDDVAYVRFASVYRNFKDIDEFVSALHAAPAAERSAEL